MTSLKEVHPTRHGWQAQLFALRFGLAIETAVTVAALALGGAHG